MKESTKETLIRTIGWTTFGIVWCFMFYGMFISMSLSNAEIKTEHHINIEADDEAVEIIKLAYNLSENGVHIGYNELDKILYQLEKDCGNTHITKAYGSTKWSSFHALKDNHYMNLDKCFNGVYIK